MYFILAIAAIAVFVVLVGFLFYFLKTYMQKEFKSISYDLLQQNAKSFLDLATASIDKQQQQASDELSSQKKAIDDLLDPMKKTLEELNKETKELEHKREKSFYHLERQITEMMKMEENLCKETATLSKALSSPTVRGTWGQIHLKRAIELAGLMEHCDFNEQMGVNLGEGIKRPDLIIHLPGERKIIIDAKTPLDAYLSSIEMEDEKAKKEKLKQHAKQLRKHVQDLSGKEYFKHFPTIECVILFLPTDAIFSSALQMDPHLLEKALSVNIVMATPSTLFAILRAVAFTWRQDALSKDAQMIAKIGTELYERLHVMTGHFEKLGKSLGTSVDAYNQTIASMDSRVLVSAKKLKDFMLKSKELKELKTIEKEIHGKSIT